MTEKIKRELVMEDEVRVFGEMSRSFSDSPSPEFTLKIKSLSLLLKNSIEKYESGIFQSGGYKWKLVLYPNGNKSKNVKEHLSLYLAIAETKSLQGGWDVYAFYRLFLYDQNKDNYFILQGNGRRFNELKLEWGFDEFISLEAFNDATNGYLVGDTCVFGAEVSVCSKRIRGQQECLSMRNNAISYKHVWKVENFSKLKDGRNDSEQFTLGDHTWKISLYPNGNGGGLGTHLSVYLCLDTILTICPGYKVFANFKFRVVDQLYSKHVSCEADRSWFSGSTESWGVREFMLLNKLAGPNSGFLVNDTLVLETEVSVLGVSKRPL